MLGEETVSRMPHNYKHAWLLPLMTPKRAAEPYRAGDIDGGDMRGAWRCGAATKWEAGACTQ